jgi:hypothetical protein
MILNIATKIVKMMLIKLIKKESMINCNKLRVMKKRNSLKLSKNLNLKIRNKYKKHNKLKKFI